MSAANHWETVKRALSLKASTARKDDGELDRAETTILKEEARTPADVIAKLKVALLHRARMDGSTLRSPLTITKRCSLAKANWTFPSALSPAQSIR
jgi:hypothetical protein